MSNEPENKEMERLWVEAQRATVELDKANARIRELEARENKWRRRCEVLLYAAKTFKSKWDFATLFDETKRELVKWKEEAAARLRHNKQMVEKQKEHGREISEWAGKLHEKEKEIEHWKGGLPALQSRIREDEKKIEDLEKRNDELRMEVSRLKGEEAFLKDSVHVHEQALEKLKVRNSELRARAIRAEHNADGQGITHAQLCDDQAEIGRLKVQVKEWENRFWELFNATITATSDR